MVSLFKKEELIQFYVIVVKRKIVTIVRFNYICNQLEKNAFFEKQDWPRQLVLWQVFDDFDKKTNNLDENIYRFPIYIEKTVLSDYLVKKYDFVNNKIIEI